MTGVLDSTSGHSSSNSSEVVINSADKDGTHIMFNEQTNYVPKRTIITVSLHQLNVYRGCEEMAFNSSTWLWDLGDIPL